MGRTLWWYKASSIGDRRTMHAKRQLSDSALDELGSCKGVQGVATTVAFFTFIFPQLLDSPIYGAYPVSRISKWMGRRGKQMISPPYTLSNTYNCYCRLGVLTMSPKCLVKRANQTVTAVTYKRYSLGVRKKGAASKML